MGGGGVGGRGRVWVRVDVIKESKVLGKFTKKKSGEGWVGKGGKGGGRVGGSGWM